MRLTHAFETHIHNDYVTGGGRALAQATGAMYLVNREDEVSYDRTLIRDGDGDVVEVGPRMYVRAIATPGRTFTHLSYALSIADADEGEPYAVFTGGSLLYGATGRPDLLGEEHTDALFGAHQHASAQKLAEELADKAQLCPTHGFASTGAFADLATVRHRPEVVVLDVRCADEFEGAAIEGAVNFPIHELPRRSLRRSSTPPAALWSRSTMPST